MKLGKKSECPKGECSLLFLPEVIFSKIISGQNSNILAIVFSFHRIY